MSTNDLLSSTLSFKRTIEVQDTIINDRLEADRNHQPIKLLIPLYWDVLTKISSFALNKVHDIYSCYLPIPERGPNKKRPIPLEYTKTIQSTLGLPCIHTIKDCIDAGQSLQLDDFHRHWRIMAEVNMEPIDPQLLVLEPAVIRPRGRPRGATNKPKRDPSFFEVIEDAGQEVREAQNQHDPDSQLQQELDFQLQQGIQRQQSIKRQRGNHGSRGAGRSQDTVQWIPAYMTGVFQL